MTAAITQLEASTRTAQGKSAARRVRAAGKVPAVAYGRGVESTPVEVTPKEVIAILKSERGQNTVINMAVKGGSDLTVMIRDYSYHPVTRSLEHVDFVQVKLDQPVEVDVPLFTTGKAAGVTSGGVLRQVFRTLPVRCLPEQIPTKLEADVSGIELGYALATKDLTLPEGVSIRLPAEQTIVSVVAPEKDRAEDAAPAAAAAAPAAGGKDAKAAPAKDAGKDAKKK